MSQNSTQILSRKERIYHFLYLTIMVIFAQILLVYACLDGFRSPFSQVIILDTQMLEQKTRFNEQQKNVEPLLSLVFQKINTLECRSPQPQVENDIFMNINNVANCFGDKTIYDPRKEAYKQISYFYQMYFEDKKILAKKRENTQQFVKQFEECSIGFKEKEQQLIQRKNRQLTR